MPGSMEGPTAQAVLVWHVCIAIAVFPTMAFARPAKQTRVVGGDSVEEGGYPWVVALDTVDGTSDTIVYSCGGSLIAPSYVLTAAHCFWPKNGKSVDSHWGTAYLGAHKACFDKDDNLDTHDNDGCDAAEIRQITALYVHASYDESRTSNDIAIVKLDSPVKTIEPVPYRSKTFADDQEFEKKGKALVLGWGIVDTKSETMASDLQVGEVRLLNTQQCRRATGYGNQIDSTNVCTTVGSTVDTCGGDSGGPLFASGAVVGITSWGVECASNKYPGVYTEVAEYSGWIDNILQGNLPPTPDRCDSFDCAAGFAHVGNAADMECPGNQCKSFMCCRATCGSYPCYGKFERVKNAANLECKNNQCRKQQCCQVAEKTCDSYTCSKNSALVAGAKSVVCKNGNCNAKQCCQTALAKKCGGYTCKGDYTLVDQAEQVTCKKSGCSKHKCCNKVYAPKYCDSVTCSGNWESIAKSGKTACDQKPNGKYVCSKRDCCQKVAKDKNKNKNKNKD